jgi:hypothetical protein
MKVELYRHFKEPEFAELFVNGVVSMGSLESYKDAERSEEMGAARHDREEGAAITCEGIVTSHKYFGNLVRVFCCSTMRDERLKEEFGEFVVRINDAEVFGLLLAEALEKEAFVLIGMQHQPVSYTDEPICISEYVFVESQSFTKPASYSYQHEYRYAFVERDELGERDGQPAALLNPARREVSLPASGVGGLLERMY